MITKKICAVIDLEPPAFQVVCKVAMVRCGLFSAAVHAAAAADGILF
jgi:hypothetical protein